MPPERSPVTPRRARPVRARGPAADSLGPTDRLLSLAETLAGAWAARARSTTTAGQERAILRLFGVHGLDRAGQPLAASVVDRWLQADPAGRTGGVALPFAMALLEYDLSPQQLALDIAAGAVDLAMEAQLLQAADRRAVAEEEARRLAGRAVARIDANRVARLELVSLLGEAVRPWIGMTLDEPDVEGSIEQLGRLVAAGADLLRVEIPVGRELAARLQAAGLDVPAWHPRHRPGGAPGMALPDPAPTGSQRGLAVIRAALDEAAAERHAYGRLLTATPAYGIPEGAVVAAFERIDLAEANPMTEIVADGVDPDRALSDHAFAHRLHGRAGTVVAIGAGPLVVAPDLSSGIPSDRATRAGRALALQVLATAFARHNGLPRESVVLGAMPDWLCEEPAPGTHAIAEVAVRRALFPDLPLAFQEPELGPERAGLWLSVVGASLPYAGASAFVLTRSGGDPATAARRARAATTVAGEVASVLGDRMPGGDAVLHARAMVTAAVTTLEQIADDGWRAVAGDPPPAGSASRSGRRAVMDRGDWFDPFEATLGDGEGRPSR